MSAQKNDISKARPFPWKCPVGLELKVFPAQVPYTAQIKHDGVLHTVSLPKLEVPRCRSCGELLFDDSADEQINRAFRLQMHLLTPEQIRSRRVAVALSQDELAERLGVSPDLISRWEDGAAIQSRAMDNLMRVYFALPGVRAVLRGRDQDPFLRIHESTVA